MPQTRLSLCMRFESLRKSLARSGMTPASQLDRRDIALAAIAAIGELDTVATGRVRHEQRARVEELAALSGPAVPALKKLIAEEKAANSSA